MTEWTTEDVGTRAIIGDVAMTPLFMDEKPAARRRASESFERWLTAHDAEVRAQARVGTLEDLMATAQERGHEHNVPMILIEECWHVMCTRAERGEA